jgi:hypothetical protein
MQYNQNPIGEPQTQPVGLHNTPVSKPPAPSLLPAVPQKPDQQLASETFNLNSEATAKNPLPLKAGTPLIAACRTVLSPAVLSGAGSSLIVLAMQPYTSALMIAATIITLRTEFRHQYQPTSMTSCSLDGRSIHDAALRRLKSRGFCLELEAIAHAVSAIVSALQGQFIKASSFCMYAAGCGSVASLSNDRPTIADHPLERMSLRAWKLVPLPVKRYLADPAALFAMGNITIFANSMATNKLLETSSLGNDLSTLALVGLGLQSLSAGWGMRHFLMNRSESRVITSLLNGSGNFCIALGLLYSSIATPSLSVLSAGGAALLWGIANFRLAWGERSTRD